jgi:DNA-binding IclR family transcriptional regulator
MPSQQEGLTIYDTAVGKTLLSADSRQLEIWAVAEKRQEHKHLETRDSALESELRYVEVYHRALRPQIRICGVYTQSAPSLL